MKGHSPYEPDAPFEDSLHRTTHGKLPHSLAANHRVKPAFSPVKRLKPISPWKDPQVKYETAVREWKKELQSVSRDKLSPTTAKRLGRIHSRVLESYLGPTISQSAQKYKRRVGLKDQRLPKLQPFGKQPHSNREGNARRLSPVRYSKPTTPAHGGSRRRRGNQVVEVVAEQLEDDSIGNELGDLSLLSGRTSISSATAGILPSRLMSARTVMREKKNDIVRAIQKAFRAKKVRDELLAKALKGRKQSLLYKGGHKLCGRLILVQARILANGFHGHVAISGRKEVEVQFRDVSQGCMGILCTTLESLYNLTGLPQHHHGSIPRLNMDFLLKRLRLESQEVLVPEQFFDDLGIYYRKHQPLTLNRTTSFALQQSGRSSQQAVRLQRIYQRCQRVVVGLCKPPHQVLCHMDSTNLALDPIEWPPERGEPPKDIRLAPLPGLHVSPFMLSMTNVGSSMSQQTARGLRASRRLDVIEEEEEDFDDVVRPRSRASAKSRPKSPKSTKNNRAITIMEVNVLTLQELSKLQHSCPNFNTGMKMLGVAFQCKVTFLPPPMNSVVIRLHDPDFGLDSGASSVRLPTSLASYLATGHATTRLLLEAADEAAGEDDDEVRLQSPLSTSVTLPIGRMVRRYRKHVEDNTLDSSRSIPVLKGAPFSRTTDQYWWANYRDCMVQLLTRIVMKPTDLDFTQALPIPACRF